MSDTTDVSGYCNILFSGTFGVAHHQLEEERRFCDVPSHLEVETKTKKVKRPRLEGHEPLTAIKNIRTNSFGKLVSVTATVIRYDPFKNVFGMAALYCSCLGFYALLASPRYEGLQYGH